MNWDHIKYFLAVARSGSLSAAAKRLNVDHTTVARRIAHLEENIGSILFVREQKGYQLTEAGQRLTAHAEAMEGNSLALQNELSDETLGATGSVRLATPEALGSQFLSRFWSVFRRRHPGIEIELVADTRPLSLNKREADIAIALARPDRGRLISSKVGEYSLKLYGSPAYLKDHPHIYRPRDLAGHEFISYVDDLIPVEQLRLLEKTLNNPRVVLRSTNVTGQTNAAVDGVGLALLPCFLADRTQGLVPILPDLINITRDLWLLTHEDIRPLARIDATMQFLSTLIKTERKTLMGN